MFTIKTATKQIIVWKIWKSSHVHNTIFYTILKICLTGAVISVLVVKQYLMRVILFGINIKKLKESLPVRHVMIECTKTRSIEKNKQGKTLEKNLEN